MRTVLAWWVKSVAIGSYPCGVLDPIRPIRLVLCSNMTGFTAGTGRGPRIYSNHMQMDQCHVGLLVQRGDS